MKKTTKKKIVKDSLEKINNIILNYYEDNLSDSKDQESSSELVAVGCSKQQIRNITSIQGVIDDLKIKSSFSIDGSQLSQQQIAKLTQLLKLKTDTFKQLMNCTSHLVVCRIRPLLIGEKKAPLQCIDDKTIKISGHRMNHTYVLNKVFRSSCSQDKFYKSLKNFVIAVLFGYKVCFMAYGRTNSGKTFTMQGLLPKVAKELFQSQSSDLWTVSIDVTYVEIYDEKIKNLLAEKSQHSAKHNIKMLNNTSFEKTISGILPKTVSSESDLIQLLEKANKRKTMCATISNSQSSRSHVILQLRISREHQVTHQKWQGGLCLVDLAGSERIDKTLSSTNHIKEAKFINRSLGELSRVMENLKKKQSYSCRNSKLTHLLEEYLRGNAKTIMIGNVSPSESHIHDTKTTLEFLSQTVAKVEVGAPEATKLVDGEIIKLNSVEELNYLSENSSDINDETLCTLDKKQETMQLTECDQQQQVTLNNWPSHLSTLTYVINQGSSSSTPTKEIMTLQQTSNEQYSENKQDKSKEEYEIMLTEASIPTLGIENYGTENIQPCKVEVGVPEATKLVDGEIMKLNSVEELNYLFENSSVIEDETSYLCALDKKLETLQLTEYDQQQQVKFNKCPGLLSTSTYVVNQGFSSSTPTKDIMKLQQIANEQYSENLQDKSKEEYEIMLTEASIPILGIQNYGTEAIQPCIKYEQEEQQPCIKYEQEEQPCIKYKQEEQQPCIKYEQEEQQPYIKYEQEEQPCIKYEQEEQQPCIKYEQEEQQPCIKYEQEEKQPCIKYKQEEQQPCIKYEQKKQQPCIKQEQKEQQPCIKYKEEEQQPCIKYEQSELQLDEIDAEVSVQFFGTNLIFQQFLQDMNKALSLTELSSSDHILTSDTNDSVIVQHIQEKVNPSLGIENNVVQMIVKEENERQYENVNDFKHISTPLFHVMYPANSGQLESMSENVDFHCNLLDQLEYKARQFNCHVSKKAFMGQMKLKKLQKQTRNQDKKDKKKQQIIERNLKQLQAKFAFKQHLGL